MMKVGKVHRILAYVAATVSLVCVILAGVSEIIVRTTDWDISLPRYMGVATVAILLAIYFLIEGAVYHAKKSE